MTSLITHKKLLEFKKQFRDSIKTGSDFQVLHDPEAGTLKIVDSDGVICLEAVQKNRRGSWIVTFRDSTSITWNWKNTRGGFF